ncbi:hypothetical protein HA402_003510 [Bradysia odoriphaga]|nr:hypothetical protein HA402_003510 [Bradysia odoriphaga]
MFQTLSSSTALLQNTSTTKQTASKAKNDGDKSPRRKSNKTTVKPSAPKRAIATSSSLSRQIVPTQSSNRIQLSTKEIPPRKQPTKSKKIKEPLNYDNDLYQCPNATQAEFQLFPTLCKRHGECIKNVGKTYRCCKQFGSKRCLRGVAKPIPEQDHAPILGLIPRKCPKEPLAELFWQLQTCETDADCWPRVCCPDGVKRYCRTSKPELEKLSLPGAKQLSYPIESLSAYLQCTPPPPPAFDSYPKKCNNTLDCFPNVCCQEEGKKHCRPPRRSLLALVTGFAQRFNTGLVRQWTDNLVIK